MFKKILNSIISGKSKTFKIVSCLLIVGILFIYNLKTIRLLRKTWCEEFMNDGVPDILDDTDNPPPKGRSIFFHETSCNTTTSKIMQINARQACAVESAARLNPNYTVYLLFTLPIRYPNVTMFSTGQCRILQELTKYKNIKIRRLYLKTYTENTPLQEWFATGQLNRSSYINSHTSDVLRYLSLWRYRGTYMDLDVVVMKSLQELQPNFAGAESNNVVAAGIINFDEGIIGKKLANLCIREIAMNFRGDVWGYNGPGVITRVLKRLCKTRRTNLMSYKKCGGFNVLPPQAFYPIHYDDWKYYFDPKTFDVTMKKLKDSFAIHVWNKFSVDTFVNKYAKEDVPYGVIAKKFCPNVYKESGIVF